MRVLIADERASLRAAVRALLEHDPQCAGIDEAAEASDALAALEFGADVVILGWGLRGMPTTSLMTTMRASRPHLILVVLGRYADARETALAAGADYYIDISAPTMDFIAVLHSLCPEIKTSVGRGGPAIE